jgi:abhydrolase domain-containing protein 6
MNVQPKQFDESNNKRSVATDLFPGFAENRLSLSEGTEITFLDNQLASGTPIVLLHGIFDGKITWFRLAEKIAGHRLIAPDLVGHGFSSKPAFATRPLHQRYSPDMQIEYLQEFISALQLHEFILLGNSLGGGLALRLYLHYPELAKKIRGLVLISSAGYPQKLPGHIRELGGWQGRLMTRGPVRALARASGLLRLSTRQTLQRCFHDHDKIPSELIDSASAALKTTGIFRAYHLSALNIVPPDIANFHQRFTEISCPTLILWGQQDRIIDPTSAARFANDIPDSAMHTFAACGHAPHLEYPDEVARRIEAWTQALQ